MKLTGAWVCVHAARANMHAAIAAARSGRKAETDIMETALLKLIRSGFPIADSGPAYDCAGNCVMLTAGSLARSQRYCAASLLGFLYLLGPSALSTSTLPGMQMRCSAGSTPLTSSLVST